MRRMRRPLIATLAVLAALIVPAVASAASQTASAGGVTATLSYQGQVGPELQHETLTITAPGMATYSEPVPAQGCFNVCDPASAHSVHVLDLYGTGEELVVLDLFTGGASCCGMEDVYVPSASIGTWVVTSRNFGQDGAGIEQLGGQWRFLSGDNAFACEFSFCAATPLPLRVWSFTADAFHDLTRQYPALIRRDAAQLWRLYQRHLEDGAGVIAAWAADEDHLGLQQRVATVLAQQVGEHHITASFVRQLQRFLKRHGYR